MKLGTRIILENVRKYRKAQVEYNRLQKENEIQESVLPQLKATQAYWDIVIQVENFAWNFVREKIREIEKELSIDLQRKLSEDGNLEQFIQNILKGNDKKFLDRLCDEDIHSKKELDLLINELEKIRKGDKHS